MALELEDVAGFLGLSPEEPLLPRLFATAEDMIADHLRPSGLARVPTSVHEMAILTLTRELWRRRDSDNGVAAWSPDGSVPVRLALDAMKGVRPMLAPYRGRPAVG